MGASLYDRDGLLYDPRRPLVQPTSYRTATLRARSPWLLNVNGSNRIPGCTSPQVDAPGMRQPFPTTAADLVKALGSPAGITPNGIYLCNTASPLVCSLGLAPNLVAAGGMIPTGRECVGLPDTTFTSKVGIEITTVGGAERLRAAVNGFGQIPAGTSRSFGVVWRANVTLAGVTDIMGSCLSAPMVGWRLGITNATLLLDAQTTTTAWANRITLASPNFADNGWHFAIIAFDGAARTISLFTDVADGGPVAYLGDIDNALGMFGLGWTVSGAMAGQWTYVFGLDGLATSAMRAAFWRHAQAAGLSSTPLTYARTNPLVVPISASRVACYGAGQVAVGYDAGLASAANGNALGTGLVCEDGITFEPIGSTDINTNWGDAGGGTHSAADGPSGMRDASRVVDAQAISTNLGYNLAIAGASNVPWRYDGNVAGVAGGGTNCRLGMYFSGDPGGPEFLVNWTEIALAVGTWKRVGGAVTPAGAAHNFVRTFFEPTDGVGASVGTVDFAEPAVVKNRATASLGWRRVGTAAAAATGTPSLSFTNTLAENRYSPIRGELRLIIAGFQGTAGAVFLQYGAPGAAGSLTLDYTGATLRLRIWDAALGVITIVGGPLTTARYSLVIAWSARNPLPGLVGRYAALLSENPPATPTLLGSWLAPWVPALVAVGPCYVGTDALGTNPARCLIAEA